MGCCISSSSHKTTRKQTKNQNSTKPANEINTSNAKTYLEYKQEGNDFFKSGKYEEAIRLYSQAIHISPDVSILYTNRGLSYLKLNAYDLAYSDGLKALEIDSNSVKAIIICSKSKANKGKIGRIGDLEESLRYGNLALKISETMNNTENQQYCNDLIEKIELMIEVTKFHLLQKEIDKIKEYYMEQAKAKETQELLDKYLTVKKIDEIEGFSCTLSMEVFKEPLVTIAGFSYEKDMLSRHINTNGHVDPLSRQAFHISTVYPNKALSKGVEWYRSTRPWLKFADNLDGIIEDINI